MGLSKPLFLKLKILAALCVFGCAISSDFVSGHHNVQSFQGDRSHCRDNLHALCIENGMKMNLISQN